MSAMQFVLLCAAVLIGLSVAVIAAVFLAGDALDEWVNGGEK